MYNADCTRPITSVHRKVKLIWTEVNMFIQISMRLGKRNNFVDTLTWDPKAAQPLQEVRELGAAVV